MDMHAGGRRGLAKEEGFIAEYWGVEGPLGATVAIEYSANLHYYCGAESGGYWRKEERISLDDLARKRERARVRVARFVQGAAILYGSLSSPSIRSLKSNPKSRGREGMELCGAGKGHNEL